MGIVQQEALICALSSCPGLTSAATPASTTRLKGRLPPELLLPRGVALIPSLLSCSPSEVQPPRGEFSTTLLIKGTTESPGDWLECRL